MEKLIDISSNPKPSLREKLERRYKNGLSSLLLIVSFTAVNLLLSAMVEGTRLKRSTTGS